MTIHTVRAHLGEGVDACFTGRDPDRADPPVGAAGNLSHRRPHRPDDLARARAELAATLGVPDDGLHLMHQVHGAEVGEVDRATPPGAELRGVDAMVTRRPGLALLVQVADCVPILLAGREAVAVVHAGRQGVAAGVVTRTVERLAGLGEAVADVGAVIGPAICGRCYEVPAHLRDEVASLEPEAAATTRWDTPALDLPAAVAAQLMRSGVQRVERLGICTLEDERFFSHRRDPAGGRQVGVVVRREAA